MPGRHLTLLVPSLAVPRDPIPSADPETAPAVKALCTMLSRARRGELRCSGLDAQLLRMFGISAADGELPVAPLTRSLDIGGDAPAWCLRCDPVHLVPGHNSLLLAASDGLDISVGEREEIGVALNRFYSAAGWLFETPTATRWYLTLPHPPRLRTHPLPQLLGHSIEGHLPGGEDGPHWRKVLAEVQMLLHDIPVNRRREQRGQPVINSLWFWGGGTLPSVDSGRWEMLWSGHPLGRALAERAGLGCRPVPAGAVAWLEQSSSGTHLLVLEEGRHTGRFGGYDAWLELLQRLEREWFAPLLEALKGGALESLTIVAGSGREFHVTRRSLWRRWRLVRTIGRLLGDDGG